MSTAAVRPNIALKLDKAPGTSTEKGYSEQIQVTSWNWSLDRRVENAALQSGNVTVAPMRLTVPHGKASAALMALCQQGKKGEAVNGILTVFRTGTDNQPVIIIKLENVIVAHVGIAGSEGRDAMEDNVTLQFTKITYEYQVADNQGKKGAKPTFTYDIAAGTSTAA